MPGAFTMALLRSPNPRSPHLSRVLFCLLLLVTVAVPSTATLTPSVAVADGPFEREGEPCAGTEYRTEDEPFARIVGCTLNREVQSFRVWTKDGRLRDYRPVVIDPKDMYGYGRDAHVAWLLREEQDRAG